MRENRNDFWPSRLAGVEAWSSAWAGDPKSRHAHDGYQITVTRSGAGTARRAGHAHACRPGEVVVFHPGEVHELVPSGEGVWQFDTLYVPAGDVREAGRADAPWFGRLPLADAALAARVAALHAGIAAGSADLKQGDGLHALLARLLAAGGRPAPEHPARPAPAGLLHARQFLDGHAEGPVALADLAAVAGVGAFHLTRLFRRAFGLPPHAYHVQVRVNRARALLRTGVPVAEVAARTGFADQAHLTRHFKRLVGVPPGRYRAASRTFKTAGPGEGQNAPGVELHGGGGASWTPSDSDD